MNIRPCLTTVLVLLTACTTTVPPTASHQSGVPIQTSTPNPTQQSAEAAAPVAPQAPTIVATAAETNFNALEKQAQDLGYRIQVHEGKRYFCRVDTPTGSRLREIVCIAPEALEEQLTAQSAQKEKLQRSTGCGNTSTCNGNSMVNGH